MSGKHFINNNQEALRESNIAVVDDVTQAEQQELSATLADTVFRLVE